jgi:hypothetical protein
MMKEAYGRGHAVQCLGREGYYWECEKWLEKNCSSTLSSGQNV